LTAGFSCGLQLLGRDIHPAAAPERSGTCATASTRAAVLNGSERRNEREAAQGRAARARARPMKQPVIVSTAMPAAVWTGASLISVPCTIMTS
jgi:hypothetical protein